MVFAFLLFAPVALADGSLYDRGQSVGVWTAFISGAEAGFVQVALDVCTFWHNHVTKKEPAEAARENRRYYDLTYGVHGRSQFRKELIGMMNRKADLGRAAYIQSLLDRGYDIYDVPVSFADEIVLDNIYINETKLNSIEWNMYFNSGKVAYAVYAIAKFVTGRVIPVLLACGLLFLLWQLWKRIRKQSSINQSS